MRRGMPRSRGMRPQHQHNPFGLNEQPTSLMADQYPGLKDIDIELELLKRKREIIEQQQRMLSSDFSQRGYEQSLFQQPSDRFNDYANAFERSGGYRGGGGSSRKRPIPVWEDEVAPKRFSSNVPRSSPSNKKLYNLRSGPARSQPPVRPWINPAASRVSAPPPKKKYTPPKPPKPTAPPQPLMKLATYKPSGPERRPKPAEVAAAEAALVLRSDRPPSSQVTGRLELALGNIVKDIKARNPDSADLFDSNHTMRAIKQAVRERIRIVMTGKVVGSFDCIKQNYIEAYPPETDSDVVLKALEVHEDKNFVPAKTDDPELYFKRNLTRLANKRLGELVKKLERIVREEYAQKSDDKEQAGAETITIDDDKPDSELAGDGKTESEAEPAAPDTSLKAGQAEHAEPDNMENGENAQAAEPAEADVAADVSIDCVIAHADPPVIEIIDTDEPAQTTDKTGTSDNKKSPTKSNSNIDEPFIPDAKIVKTDTYVALNKLLTLKMPFLIKKYAPTIIHLMDLDDAYRKLKNEVRETTAKQITKRVESSGARDYIPLKYFVKIMGKPALPKRKQMQAFFDEYKPKSIKKHRAVHNLLFVAFTEKEPFERILAANGTTIGRYILDIRVSEKVMDKKPDSSDSELPIDLSADIDGQITDLLTIIKKDEEGDSNEDVVLLEDGIKEETTNGDNDDVTKTDDLTEGQDNGQDGDEGNTENEEVQNDNEIEQDQYEDEGDNNENNFSEENDDGNDQYDNDGEQWDDELQNDNLESLNDNVESLNDNVESLNDNMESQNDNVETQNDHVDTQVEEPEPEEDTPAPPPAQKEEPKPVKKPVQKQEAKEDVTKVGTPVRTSARLASTPSTIRTRRTSRLQ